MEDWDRMVTSMKEKIMDGDTTPIEYLDKTITFFRENYHKDPQPALLWNLINLRDELNRLKETSKTIREIEGGNK
ncbi:MAG: hypothetical protein PVF58_01650 [Candidatus Methanofastidiosia archaeon]|jgi:hypothetical protein